MATKLEAFLTEAKIDHRRLLAASRQLERLLPQDRAVKLAHRQALKKEDGAKPKDLPKRRSGRPITKVALTKALVGKHISAPTRSRMLRAVNRILEQRKKSVVTMDALFD